jgi:hypothetical protein
LIALLRISGLQVWADDSIEFGERWWRTIVAAIRSCAAMVVVMTPTSEESRWVEREVMLAEKLKKPIFPLLLKGDGFPLLMTLHHYDVRDGSMPPMNVIKTLGRLAEREEGEILQPTVESRRSSEETDRTHKYLTNLMQALKRLTGRFS